MSYQLCTTTQKMLGSLVPLLVSVPEVRHYHENAFRIAPEEAKSPILLVSASAQVDAEKLVCADGVIRTMFPA